MQKTKHRKRIAVVVAPVPTSRAFAGQRTVGELNADNPTSVSSYRKVARKSFLGVAPESNHWNTII